MLTSSASSTAIKHRIRVIMLLRVITKIVEHVVGNYVLYNRAAAVVLYNPNDLLLGVRGCL
jgi:hypothetical protein